MSANAAHDAMKADPELWDLMTIPIGLMDDGTGNLLSLANCRMCHSTLARPTKL